ncbi:MAG: acyl carrier protein [Gammaproteobacteria bacterium]|nr:acyl carrier protein [Gammaproteobacteria bacterium]MEE2769598.1 acyl carrier protein [Pseudomonadota bacterium]
MSEPIIKRVSKIVVEQLGIEESAISATSSFQNDLGADSLDTVELIMAFEEEFGVNIPEDEAEKIVTIADAIEYIEKHSE